MLALGAAATALAVGAPAAAQDVEAGVRAWQAERYDEAVRNWRPLADRGDADAQFNLGHAYRLGRGVPRNMNLAEQWYERAARAGHVEAQAMYGLILFQNGRRREAMPYVERAALAGDARAQYVYGTALFNGDVIERDWPRAHAFLTLAAGQGLPYASSQLEQMQEHLSEDDRARGTELAARMVGTGPARSERSRVAAAEPLPTPAPSVANRPADTRTAAAPSPPPAQRQEPSAARAPATTPVRQAEARPTVPEPPRAAPSGRWRIQLGAFSSDANARRAWSQFSGRLGGLQPFYVRAGNLVRLQAGPLADRAAAGRACSALRGQACFPVAP
ncbi:SPOR domain-containing protein [Sphingosinicella terrae]|uniref:SPOR domain-containing protein n=1 Tax=Sphingosinicella terrae TaxID=2172047 RepID=UPI0013B35A60|nr:SPOR domain-containing protein [Sphingosinicella terrae]